MMKKLLLLGFALFIVCFGAKAQSTPVLVIDTLHYYFNKYYFKTGATTYSNYPNYKSAASTVTNVTHCGSRFENIDTLIITGLEAFAMKNVSTANLQIPVHLYLCLLDVNNMPIMPPVDSVITAVGGLSVNSPSVIGGNFAKPYKVMNRDFAVLFRNMSTVAGDTVQLLRTNGATQNNMAAQPYQRSSDGNYGYVRHLGTFYSTQNFTLSYGFGIGTDYEFMVAPRVMYNLQASFQTPQNILDFNADPANVDTICTRTPFTFTNTSSYQYTNRFYNLIEFYRKWNLYSSFNINAQPVVGGWPADSSITWNFEYEEQAMPPRDPRTFLPYKHQGMNHGTITSTTDMQGCFANQFRARLKPMSAFGRGSLITYNENFNICMSYCDKDGVGIRSVGELESVDVYPNPLVNGSTSISGLKGRNTVLVYDILGQLVLNEVTENSSFDVNLSGQSSGTYIIRVTNEKNQSKVIKVVH